LQELKYTWQKIGNNSTQ